MFTIPDDIDAPCYSSKRVRAWSRPETTNREAADNDFAQVTSDDAAERRGIARIVQAVLAALILVVMALTLFNLLFGGPEPQAVDEAAAIAAGSNAGPQKGSAPTEFHFDPFRP